MMADLKTPSELKYAKSDEWVKIEGDIAIVGISDFAQDQLNDIVYVEYTVSPNDEIAVGDAFASVESVKAASDIYSHVAGVVLEVNKVAKDSPETLNSDPFGAGWLIKVKLSGDADLTGLMDAEAYKEYCAER